MPIENNTVILILSGSIILLAFWTIIQQFTISKIKNRQKSMLQGSDGKSLEKIIIDTKQKISTIDGDIKDLYEITNKIHSLSHQGLHKMGIVRFNPFRDIGGDQSFSVALLDGDNNGVVLSSLYSRDGVRVYAKQLSKGQSENYQLTEEEKQAIEIASFEKNGAKNKKRI